MDQQEAARSALMVYGILNVISVVCFCLGIFIPVTGVLTALAWGLAIIVNLWYFLLVILVLALPFAAFVSVGKNGIWLPAVSFVLSLVEVVNAVSVIVLDWQEERSFGVSSFIPVVVNLIVAAALFAYFVDRRKQKRQTAELHEKQKGTSACE